MDIEELYLDALFKCKLVPYFVGHVILYLSKNSFKIFNYFNLIFSFVAFNQVRIPRENLLNKTADVTPAGEYVTPYKDPSKRFGAALGALSGGRVGITSMAVANLRLCMPIAIRYNIVVLWFNEVSVLFTRPRMCRTKYM